MSLKILVRIILLWLSWQDSNLPGSSPASLYYNTTWKNLQGFSRIFFDEYLINHLSEWLTKKALKFVDFKAFLFKTLRLAIKNPSNP